MAKAINTHVPAHCLSHIPRQWSPKPSQSVYAQDNDDMEADYSNESIEQPHWNDNFGAQAGIIYIDHALIPHLFSNHLIFISSHLDCMWG